MRTSTTSRKRRLKELEFEGSDPIEVVVRRWCEDAFHNTSPPFDPLYHPLEAAVERGTVSDVAVLLEHGRECALRLDARDKFCGYAPRLLEGSNFETTEFMRRCRSPVACAAQKGDLAMVQYLISQGASVDGTYAENCARTRTRLFHPALHHAVADQNVEMIHFLLNAGANVDIANLIGETALILAAERGFTAIVRLLLAHGAAVDARGTTYGRRTALFYAADRGALDLVTTLLDHGAAVNATNEEGATVLFDAVGFNGTRALVDEFLRRGATIEHCNPGNGRTPLIQAACRGNLDAVRSLLAAGADASAKDERGRTALMHAARRGLFEIVDAFLRWPRAKSILELTDCLGNTALGHAVLSRGDMLSSSWDVEGMGRSAYLFHPVDDEDEEDENEEKPCRKNISRVLRLLLSNGALSEDVC